MDRKAGILVVDDDESIRTTFSYVLEDEGHEVETAESEKEVIEKTKTGFYDLALLDVRLPDMEGTELSVKMWDITPKMVKIMITGYPLL